MTFHAVTEKRLDLARRSALSRLGANIDRVVTSAALKLGFDSAELERAHVSARNRYLAKLGLKLSERGAAAAAAEAPILDVVFGKSISLWNENAVRADGRVGFPV